MENFRPGVIDRLGIGFDRMREANPGVILVSVSGFGQESPYRDLPAYDLILQAMTGHMSIMGEAGRPPVIMGIPIADLLAGVFAAIAVLAGVEGNRETRRGAHLDVAMFDVMVEMLAHVGTLFLNTGSTRNRAVRPSLHHTVAGVPMRRRRLHRRRAARGTLLDEAAFGARQPPRAGEAEFDEARSRQSHRDELLPLLESIFGRRTSTAWLEVLREAGVPAAPVNRMPAIFEDPHVAARDMIRSFPVGGQDVRAIGNAIKVVGTDERTAGAPPRWAADTESVLRSVLGYDDERLERLDAAGVFGKAASIR